MKTKAHYLLVVVLVLALGALIIARTAEAQNAQQAPRAVKWEYTDGANLNVAQMNALGDQGWEMVTFVSYGKDLYYVFKRPK
jgi:hypothetical protein